ncbi:MAG: hypothetical protein K0S54_3380 [Alphaproteobacteria bacterium]|jgi:hypothetical protein|nr:hypothetical protein [Alphaproteobacteria bacterium]
MRKALTAGAALIAPAILLAAVDLPVRAQGTPSAVTPPSAAGKPPAETVPQAITAEVTGFRSARFGMTDEQVREAIKRDFDVDAKDVKKLRNEVQKTDILAIQVENLVPGSGTSLVFYIFGYSTKRLIHINVVWGRMAQQTVTPASLVNTGTILQNYFKNLGLAVTQGGSTRNQVTLFQGFDEKKRVIQLVMEIAPMAPAKPEGKAADAKTPDPKAAAKPAAKPTLPAQPAQAGKPADGKAESAQYVATSLMLSYVESVANPDIYTVPKGKF